MSSHLHRDASVSLSELGALVESLAAMGVRLKDARAFAAIDEILDGYFPGLLHEASVRAHFAELPERVRARSPDESRLWCRIPDRGEGPFEFLMGSPEDEADREPTERQATVTLSQPFWLCAATVTRTQWSLFQPRDPRGIRSGGEGELPVTEVDWFESRLYCRWLQRQRQRNANAWSRVLPAAEGFSSCVFTLPTEAQWEFACRAWYPRQDRAPRFWSGDSEEDLARVAWCRQNSGVSVHAVAERPSNDWGLFDMHGNVWEWCLDRWGDRLVGGRDPRGSKSARRRVLRGGSYRFEARFCRSASRIRYEPDGFWGGDGFRLALSAPESAIELR